MARIGKKNTEKVETTDVLAYRFRIFPNDKQKVIFAKTFGCARNRDYQAAINILREGVHIFNEEYHIQYVL